MKNILLKSYKHVVWDLIEGLEAFNLQSVLRNQNKQVDRLAAIGAQYDISSEINKDKGKNHVKFIVRPAIPINAEIWQVFYFDQHIVNFLREEVEVAQPNHKKLQDQYEDQII